jgi:glycosyltransferase involved in cell wall biosynthesis
MPDLGRSLRNRVGDAARRSVAHLARFAPDSILRIVEAGVDAEIQRRIHASVGSLSDGELVVRFAEVLLDGRGANSDDVEWWKEYLDENPARRETLLRKAVSAYLARPRTDRERIHDPNTTQILGTNRFLRLADWKKLAAKHGVTASAPKVKTDLATRSFHHSGHFTVSAIASLYKGAKYIERFLDNITSQTIFDRCELIIIDANSPDGEAEIIDQYRNTFPNIVYKRINHRIGIYDAWNIGVDMSRGKFITNTNLDDLRKENSFELQASALERHSFADVVYQDFFYSMDDALSFDEVAKVGIKSDVPIVTPHNLLLFNSPHNAPMWRKKLHSELGAFDTTFESAGDWEFWLRCISSGKTFFKINEPHVVYFQNPEGVSTRPNTKGVKEGRRVWRRYSSRLVSPSLRMSRKDFSALLGGETDWNQGTSYYAAAQRRLVQLGQSFRAQTAQHQGDRS